MTKVPKKKAANLKNNFYLLQKLQQQTAEKQTQKCVAMIEKAKKNRIYDVEISRQSLVRLKATRSILRDLAHRSDRIVQHQTQTVLAIIKSVVVDKPIVADPNCKEQYEADLQVKTSKYSQKISF